jgi:hypothetical protein
MPALCACPCCLTALFLLGRHSVMTIVVRVVRAPIVLCGDGDEQQESAERQEDRARSQTGRTAGRDCSQQQRRGDESASHTSDRPLRARSSSSSPRILPSVGPGRDRERAPAAAAGESAAPSGDAGPPACNGRRSGPLPEHSITSTPPAHPCSPRVCAVLLPGQCGATRLPAANLAAAFSLARAAIRVGRVGGGQTSVRARKCRYPQQDEHCPTTQCNIELLGIIVACAGGGENRGRLLQHSIQPNASRPCARMK